MRQETPSEGEEFPIPATSFWEMAKYQDDAALDSPYRFFSAEDWQEFRADTPLTLSEDEVRRLRSMNDPISLDEVERIYLSISRLLSDHVEALQRLFAQRRSFLQFNGAKTPFVIGIAGPVAVGEIDDGPNPEGAFGPVAVKPQG